MGGALATVEQEIKQLLLKSIYFLVFIFRCGLMEKETELLIL